MVSTRPDSIIAAMAGSNIAGGTGAPIGGALGVDYTDGTFPYADFNTIFSRQLSPLDGDDVSQDAKATQNTYRFPPKTFSPSPRI